MFAAVGLEIFTVRGLPSDADGPQPQRITGMSNLRQIGLTGQTGLK
jgi:hypothetical protein